MHFSQVQLNAVVAGKYFRNIDKNRDERLDEAEIREFHAKIADALQRNDTPAARAALKATDDLLKDIEAQKAGSGRQMQYNNSREGFYNRTNPDQGELYTVSWLDLVAAATGRTFDREMEAKTDKTSTSNMYQHYIGSPDVDQLELSQNVQDGITEFAKISMVLFGEAPPDMLPTLEHDPSNNAPDGDMNSPPRIRQRRRPHDNDLLGLGDTGPRRTQSIYTPPVPQKTTPPEYWSQLPQDVKDKLETQFRQDINDLMGNETPENLEKAKLIADLYKKLTTDELPLSALKPKPIDPAADQPVEDQSSASSTDDSGTRTTNPATRNRPSVQERIAQEKEKILARQSAREAARQSARAKRSRADIYKPMDIPMQTPMARFGVLQLPWTMPMNPMGSPMGAMMPTPFLWREFMNIVGTCSWATNMHPSFYMPPVFVPPMFPQPMPMGMPGMTPPFMPPPPMFNYGFDANYNPAAMIMNGAAQLISTIFSGPSNAKEASGPSTEAPLSNEKQLDPNLKAAVLQQYDIALKKAHDIIQPGYPETFETSKDIKDEALKILQGIMEGTLPPDTLAKFNDMLSGVNPNDPNGYHQQMFNSAVNGTEPLLARTQRQLEEAPEQVEKGKQLAQKSVNPQEILNKYGALYQSIMDGRSDPSALENYTTNLQNEALSNRPIDTPSAGGARSPQEIAEGIMEDIGTAAANGEIPRILIDPGDNPKNFIEALRLINPAYKDIPDVDILKSLVAANMDDYPPTGVFKPGNEIKLPEGFLTDIGLEELERTGIDKGANLPPLTQENMNTAWRDLIITNPDIEGIEDYYADGAGFIDEKFRPSEPPDQNVLVKQQNGTYTFADGNSPPKHYLNADNLYLAVTEGAMYDTEGNKVNVTPELKAAADAKLKALAEPFKKDLVDEYKLHMQENVVFNQWLNGKIKLNDQNSEIIGKILHDKGLDVATADPKSVKSEIFDTLKKDAKRYLWLREEINHNNALTDQQKTNYKAEQDALISRSPLLLNLDAVKDTKDGFSWFDDAKGGFRTLWGLTGRNGKLSDAEIDKEVDDEINKAGGMDNILQLAEKKAYEGLAEAQNNTDFANTLLHDTGLTMSLTQRMMKTKPIPQDQSSGLMATAMYAMDNKKSCTETADTIGKWASGAGLVVSFICPPIGVGLFTVAAAAEGYAAYNKWNMSNNNFRALESSADGVSKVGDANTAGDLQWDAVKDGASATAQFMMFGAGGTLLKAGVRTLRYGSAATRAVKAAELTTKAAEFTAKAEGLGKAAAEASQAAKSAKGFAIFNSEKRALNAAAKFAEGSVKENAKMIKNYTKLAQKISPQTKWIQLSKGRVAMAALTGGGSIYGSRAISSLQNPLGNRPTAPTQAQAAEPTPTPDQIVQHQGNGYALIGDKTKGMAHILMQERDAQKVEEMLTITSEFINNGTFQNAMIELKTQAQQLTATRLIQNKFPQLADKVNFVVGNRT